MAGLSAKVMGTNWGKQGSSIYSKDTRFFASWARSSEPVISFAAGFHKIRRIYEKQSQ
jgi:hypothetical protein